MIADIFKQNSKELSIVLPAYKERENLAIFIPEIEKAFNGYSFEIIIIDDNSQDGTKELIESLNGKFGNIKLISRPRLMGIGSALRDGYNMSQGEFILSSDADLSFVVEDMKRLFETIKGGYDIVLGYKIEYKPLKQEDKPLWVRVSYIISQVGNWTIKNFSGMKNIHNFNTNFRILRRSKWLEIKTVEDRHFFLFETIFRILKKGAKITEIPVVFYNRRFGDSKMNFLKEAPKYFLKLTRYVFFDK